ncbi:hypothetical protein P4O66_014653 [Electrophorus voltai]|uniref:Immunoglobulin V-set domain-containing protein n=1 Tax=Electrophorus voltai TaxID=2609070 RepID=A0AAD8Z3I1_9TELE|nr:hypothetical protein P4O66_014653 [Electrophorus voltai]
MAGIWRCMALCLLMLHTGTVPHGQLALYVQEQASVQFVIPKQERQFLILDWIHRAEHVVVSYNHKHKDIVKKPWDNVEFNMETFALTLKNVQKNQSGEYVAKMRTSSTNQIVAHYRIFVQDNVEHNKEEETTLLGIFGILVIVTALVIIACVGLLWSVKKDDMRERETTEMHLYSNSESVRSNSIYMNIHTNRNSTSSVPLEGHTVNTYVKEDSDYSIYMNSGLLSEVREGESGSVDDCVCTEMDDICGAYGSTMESENIYANHDTGCL